MRRVRRFRLGSEEVVRQRDKRRNGGCYSYDAIHMRS
jgi:hypothetical protein